MIETTFNSGTPNRAHPLSSRGEGRGEGCRSRSRSGLALVIVLGFLAVLAVLAVSLIITMRIERLATSSFAEVSRSRQLIHAALARALDDIDRDMNTRDALYPQDDPYALATGDGRVGTNFLADKADLYIPGAEYPNPVPAFIRLNEVVNPAGRIIGRVGYYAINSSGLLDANIIGGRARGQGRSGEEIPLSPTLLAEVNNATEFLKRRTNYWRRIESLPELYYLGIQGTPRALATNPPPEHLFIYSNFGLDLKTNGQPKISLAGTANDFENNTALRTNVIAGLIACGVPLPDQVFNNFLDYIDTDFEPRDLDSFCTEAVPMINEVIFSNSVTQVATTNGPVSTHRIYMTIETWHPFPDKGFNDVRIVGPSPLANFNLVVPAELTPDPVAHLITPGPYAINPNHTPNSFRLTTFVWQRVATNVPFASPQVAVRINLSGDYFVETASGVRLDKASLPPANIAIRAPLPGGPAARIASFAVKDPRLNYDRAQWESQADTFVTPNTGNRNAENLGEGISTMYVRDFPLHQNKVGAGLGSVSDLGFLSVGTPWRTIALYNTPGVNLHPVLDQFTLATNAVRRALVNINSPHIPVLASAFYDLPIESHPGGSGPNVSINAARLMAGHVVSNLAVGARYEKNRSIAVVGDFNSGFVGSMNSALSSPALTNDALIESVIRNSADLFSYRQNLFTVLLYAQSITLGGTTGAEQRAVAVVWRDPEYDDPANQTNKTLLRFFKWL